MKPGMKTITLSILFASQITFAKSGGVRVETWSCQTSNRSASMVTDLTATIDIANMTSQGALKDWGMSPDWINISADSKSDLSTLTGDIQVAHDNRSYEVKLVRSSENEGKAIVNYSGFVDCVGDISATETLDCSIRAAQ